MRGYTLIPVAEDMRTTVRNALTVTPTDYTSGASLPPIYGYIEDGGQIYAGPAYARKMGVTRVLDVATGHAVDYPTEPVPRNEDQREFFEELVALAEDDSDPFLAKADTGFGKTVASAYMMARLGRTAIIIVTTKILARQWKNEIVKHTGLNPNDVGILSGWQKDTWSGKPVVIAIVNSIINAPAEFDPDFYGVAIWDEVHRMGAREFCKSLQMFKSETRLGLSATPKRKDGLDVLFLSYFGSPSVVASCPPMPCHVHSIVYSNPATQKASRYQAPPRVLNMLSDDSNRNAMIANQIIDAWERGRVCFAVGDRIEQLGRVKYLLVEAGVPASCIGMIAGQEYDARTGARRKIKEDEEDAVKADARFQIMLCTYGKAREGLDIPRMDWGIDVTPRATGEQVVGRIRRLLPDKPTPVWVTILDKGVTPFSGYYTSRIRDLSGVAGITIK